jgi:pimeloyl-ACP methyl ester carboxylesterase
MHSTADPMFPREHGEAVAEEIPGATLLPLEGAGHGLNADYRQLIDEQSSYFLYYAMGLQDAQR